MDTSALATYFDGWYADMARFPAKDELLQRHLSLPPEVLVTNALPWAGIAEVVEALRLEPGRRLLDLACGRGGFGLEVARRTGARLTGLDLSPEALRQATALAAEAFPGVEARFQTGDLIATGLEDGSVDAVLCVDAVQFAEEPSSAYAELHRVLVPGGRVVLTCWEPVRPGDDRLPARLWHVDLAAGLSAAGFTDVTVVERRDWREVERGMWQEAVRLDPGEDPALRSLHDEGVRSLATFDLVRRVLGSARRPRTLER
jgi:SAM-dependent methyltransferase